MPNCITSLAEDLIQLFYPHHCLGCGDENLSIKALLCPFCFSALPRTQYVGLPNNPTERIFSGRLSIEQAYSEFYFQKESVIQHMLHQLKYNHKTNIGEYLGEMMGETMATTKGFAEIDAIVALPLNKAKEKKRGYNQSAFLAKGISSVLGKPVLENTIERIRHTETQTRKQREERWINVAYSFKVKNPALIEHKHVLLVDDVITTGASIESCGRCLLSVPGVKLSVASAAITI